MARSRKDPRHRAREAALQILYQWDIGKRDIDRSSATFFDLQWPNVDPPADHVAETVILRDERQQVGKKEYGDQPAQHCCSLTPKIGPPLS